MGKHRLQLKKQVQNHKVGKMCVKSQLGLKTIARTQEPIKLLVFFLLLMVNLKKFDLV
jgi:hypothetical protein